jgi:hypothetical protein
VAKLASATNIPTLSSAISGVLYSGFTGSACINPVLKCFLLWSQKTVTTTASRATIFLRAHRREKIASRRNPYSQPQGARQLLRHQNRVAIVNGDLSLSIARLLV